MIAARQIAFGRGAGKRKPYDAEVEYLESTGTQYIDTGILAKAPDSYELSVWFASEDHSRAFFGAANDSERLATVWATVGGALRFGGGWAFIPTVDCWVESAWNKVVCSYSLASINNVSLNTAATKEFDNFRSTMTLWLFKCNGFNSPSNVIRIASFKWYASGVLALDLIPVRVGNVGYMYDKVSGTLFGNSGTGDFVLGPDLIDYTAKDYVQDGLIRMLDGLETGGFGVTQFGVRGFQWIDCVTGAIYQNNNLIALDDGVAKFSTYGSSDIPFGAPSWSEWTVEYVATLPSYGSDAPFIRTSNPNISYPNLAGYNTSYNRFVFWGGSNSDVIRVAVESEDNQNDLLVATAIRSLNSHNGILRVGDKASTAVFLNSITEFPECDLSFTDYTSPLNDGEPKRCRFKCVRLYSRALTAEEVAHNYSIDKARFGL